MAYEITTFRRVSRSLYLAGFLGTGISFFLPAFGIPILGVVPIFLLHELMIYSLVQGHPPIIAELLLLGFFCFLLEPILVEFRVRGFRVWGLNWIAFLLIVAPWREMADLLFLPLAQVQKKWEITSGPYAGYFLYYISQAIAALACILPSPFPSARERRGFPVLTPNRKRDRSGLR